MRTVEIGKNDAGQRLDKFLRKAFPALPETLMYKYIRTKKIKVCRKRAEIGMILNEGDTVELFIKEEFFGQRKKDELYKSIKPTLDVVYEDKNVLICDKPAGMLSHSDISGESDTLIEHIKAYLWHKGEYVPEDELSFAPALCNRLDRNTGGLVITAKNAESLRVLNDKIKRRVINKYYICAVLGAPPAKSGVLEGYLIKNEKTNTVKVFREKPSGNAKKIVTGYRLMDELYADSKKIYLLEIELITGRTHQIRAHLASAGMPLLGEGKYAVNRESRKLGFSYQALYSYKLVFGRDDTPTSLDYLTGKTVELDRERIYFLRELGVR